MYIRGCCCCCCRLDSCIINATCGPCPSCAINSTANNNGNQAGPASARTAHEKSFTAAAGLKLTWHALTVLLSADLAAAAAR